MDWLSDPSRVYPVAVDPSLSTNFEASQDCWLRSYQPNEVGGCGASATYVWAGRNGDNQRRRGLLKFDVSGIPSTATVSSASVNLYLDATKTADTSMTLDYTLNRVAKAFNGQATWNSPGDGSSWTGGSPGAELASTSIRGANSGYRKFTNMSGAFQAWIQGSATNNGVVLKQDVETRNNYIAFYSSASGKEEVPYVDLTYTLPTNDPEYVADGEGAPPANVNGPINTSDDPPAEPDKQLEPLGADGFVTERPATKKLPDHNRILESKDYSTIDPPRGRASTIGVYQKADVRVPFFERSALFKTTYVRATWAGSTPANADRMTLGETWAVSGISISVSLPAGVSATGSGSSRTRLIVKNNEDDMRSTTSNVKFSGVITRVRHDGSGLFTFGSQSFTVNTSDGSWV